MMEPKMYLRDILIQTFKNTSIPEEIKDLKMGDFDEWDSLGNFNLLLAVETKYKIQFDFNELENLTSIASIQKVIDNALP